MMTCMLFLQEFKRKLGQSTIEQQKLNDVLRSLSLNNLPCKTHVANYPPPSIAIKKKKIVIQASGLVTKNLSMNV